MNDDPNQQIPNVPPPVDDIDARIAAERRAAAQYAGYQQEPNGGIRGFFSNLRARPKLAIPLLLVPILLISIVAGFSISKMNSKQEAGNGIEEGTQELASTPQSDAQNASDVPVTPNGDQPTSNTSGSTPSSTGTGTNPNTSTSGGTKPTPKAPTPVPVRPAPTPPPPVVTPPVNNPSGAKKVLIFVEENHSISSVTASSMPYAYNLTRQYGYATNYTFLNGDSLPNYIAIAAGTTAGTTNSTSTGSVKLKSVFKQVIDSGKTAVTYIHNMSGNCKNSGSGSYSDNHNPWVYFGNEKTECGKFNVPFTRFDTDVKAGNLPNFGMIVPDNAYNAHNGTLQAADDWFKARMQTVFASPDWTSGRLAVIFLFDEPKKGTTEKVYMSVIHSSTKGRGVVGKQLNHYSLTRLGAEMIGAQPLEKGATANSVLGAFGLKL